MPSEKTSCLRKLRMEDAPLMLEWMQDKNIVKYLYTDFQHKTLQDCQQFIQRSWQDQTNLHLAVADESDVYRGTVSLKSIDRQGGTAEFGICMHPAGMGKGLSQAAMAKILSYGNKELGLKAVYWCVSTRNARANRFYQKSGYKTVDTVPALIQNRYHDLALGELVWYGVTFCSPVCSV